MKKKKNKLKFNFRFLLVFVLLLVLFGTLSSFYFYQKSSGAPKVNSLVKTKPAVYPTLYSDKNITKNAIVSDPRFKNKVIFSKETLTANVSSFLKKEKTFISSGGTIEKGSWLWTPVLNITPEYRSHVIQGAKSSGIKNIYLSIDSYLDIYVMPDGQEKNDKKIAFDEILRDFIKEAKDNGITVDAEGGWRNWAETGNQYKAFAVLDYAIEFNKTYPEKLRGFQYDVEPYLLDHYQNSKKTVLRNLVNLIDESVVRLEESDLELTVVIPEFYDGANGETPTFFYGGRLGYAFDHLLSILENRSGSKIIVMSYRNFSVGPDGAIEISKDEVTKANKYETKIILAQETGDVEPPYITFHKNTRSYYNKEVKKLEKAFEKDKSFNGIAAHYLNAFMELK